MRNTCATLLFFLAAVSVGSAQWLAIDNFKTALETTELGGPGIGFEYDLNDATISSNHPVYVFIRFCKEGENWRLLPPKFLRDNGHDMVNSQGHKKSIWWGDRKSVV